MHIKRVIFFIFTTCLAVLFFWYFSQENLSAAPKTASSPYQIGAFFYYWYHCPGHYCDKNFMPYIPATIDTYTNQDPKWYEYEIAHMKKAGLGIILPVSWGSRSPADWFQDKKNIPLLIEAMQKTKSPLKIALFDDTSSEYAEWNMDHKRGYQQPDDKKKLPNMALDDGKNKKYFYEHKIQPFYRMIPKTMWATHNGKSVDKGGKPVIVVYKASWFSKSEEFPKLWKDIKQQFKNDFGVEPFIILDTTWFQENNAKQLEQVIDGKYAWSGPVDYSRKQTIRNYTTVSLNAGVSCTNNKVGCGYDKPRNVDFVTGIKGDEGLRLTSMFHSLVPGSNLVLLETWNELWEGTQIAESPFYPKNNGSHLPDDYYIQLLKKLATINN